MKQVWRARNNGIARHRLVRKRAEAEGAKIVVGKNIQPGASETRIGWGYKSSGLWAKDRPGFRLFEDGFVRSLRPGYSGGALFSLVEDGKGIYYDGDGKSDLVDGLNGGGEIGANLRQSGWREDAEKLLNRFVEIGASKYNWFPFEHDGPEIEHFIPDDGILVVDQTRGDAAIQFGKGTPENFDGMVLDALNESSGPVYLRSHPDMLHRRRASCFSGEFIQKHLDRIRLVPSSYSPRQVFSQVSRVFVFNSLFGMEALAHGKEVRVYGCPFYSGWGVTDDRHPEQPVRRESRDLLEIFYSAYLLYSRYFDPVTEEECGLDRILDHLELQKEKHALNRGDKLLFGFPEWKSRLISDFVACPGAEISSTRSPKKAWEWIRENDSGKIISWSVRETPFDEMGRGIRVEDGFLRSVGLGADFHRPISLVFDSRGMYFDATRPSDLERILQESQFTEDELKLAEQLIDFLVRNRITKYNLRESAKAARWPGGRGPRVLVPGQVEQDASLSFGLAPCQSNLEFMRRVKERNPHATIAFKPHPDVVKRLRPGQPIVEEMKAHCDVVVTELDINPWLDSCDEVHTLTSQTGFEALLRGKKVTCHGIPFYSGWGLTNDLQKTERRDKILSVPELVAGALIRYPVYLHPRTREFINAGDAARLLKEDSGAEFSRPRIFRMATAAKRWLHPLRF